MSTLFAILFFLSLILLVVGLISPKAIAKLIRTILSRKKLSLIFASSTLVFFMLIGFTAPKPSTENTAITTEEKEETSIPEQQPTEANLAIQPVDEDSPKTTATVTDVVDGDTIKVSIAGTAETIRLIGIDTPETVDPRKPVQCFGVEASNKSKATLQGKTIQLENDPPQGERDKYGRLLRYVFLEDGTNFNEMMIREGYAYEYTYNLPYKYQTAFKTAQTEAEANKDGLWAEDTCNGSNLIQSEQSAKATPTPQSETGGSTPPISNNEPTGQCSSNAYNCDDFDTHAEAQTLFESCGGVNNDVHRLDQDKDGLACETLP